LPALRTLAILAPVFLVTTVDHSAIPNVFVLAMVAASGKGIDPYVLFATATASVLMWEHAVYWMGRSMNGRDAGGMRLAQWFARGAEAATSVMGRRPKTWMLFGRFLGGLGLYVPFAFGHMGRGYARFVLLSTVGTLFHLAVFGVPAYILGDRFRTFVERVPLGWITLGIMAVVAASLGWQAIRRRRAEPSSAD